MSGAAGAIAALAVAAANARRALDDEEFEEEFEEAELDKKEFSHRDLYYDYKPTSKYEKIKDKIAWSFLWISALSCILAIFQLGYYITPIARHKDAKKQGVKQILNSAHSDAANSAYTINLADYETTSKIKAKCDSLYYARKVSHFIYLNGNKFVKPKPITKEVYGVRYVIGYVAEIDQNRIYQDPKFNKYLTGYKKSVQQLAVQRRINNQR